MGEIKADMVLRNASVITMDPHHPHGRTVYIRGGKVSKVSVTDVEQGMVGSQTIEIDCQGKTVIPGFHDAHCHILGYADSLANIDISPSSVHSIDDIVSKIKDAASLVPAGKWIRCSGYNEYYPADKRHPTRQDLDRATISHPVKLTHRSGHAHVLNTLALARTVITNESEEPNGGMIERDLESGDPNGILFGMGSYLARIIPLPDEGELDGSVAMASAAMLRLGITSVQDASASNDLSRWKQFISLKCKGIFAPKTILMFGASEVANLPLSDPATGLSSGAVKIMLDEVRGHINPSQSELNSLVNIIHELKLQVAIHAVEEATIDAASEAISFVQQKNPNAGQRHRIEHCSVCTADNAQKLARCHAMVVTNPAFIYYSGERYLSTVPENQLQHLYPIGTLLKSGLTVAAGSDAPVAHPDPLKGIYAAVTRKSESGQYVLKDEAIPLLDALKLYTVNGAWSCFQEKQLGTIAENTSADVAILNTDLSHVRPDDLRDISVAMTILDGKLVYSSGN